MSNVLWMGRTTFQVQITSQKIMLLSHSRLDRVAVIVEKIN